MKRKIIGAMAALSIGAALFAGEKTVDFARVNDPSTRSTYSVILNSNFRTRDFKKRLLNVPFVCNSVCNFSNKNRFPPQRGKTEKSFNFFLNRGEIFYLKRPIESRERPRRPNSSISMRGSSLLRPSRSPLRKRSRSS